MRPVKPLADRIADGSVNVCCLVEANLYVEEHVARHKIVRVCRICHRRHIRMRAESIPLTVTLNRPNFTHKTAAGRRHIRMGASPGGFGAGGFGPR
jgi:hypothetical protein